MGNQDFLIGLAAAIVALSALFFAIFQAVAAFSQLMSARGRCGRRVTGAFDLRAGIWLALMTLTPHVKYRMPVITMPGLRCKIPVMGPATTPVDFAPGLNFKENAYVDNKRARVYGPLPREGREGPIDYPKTALTILRNVLWAPFAAASSCIALVAAVLCAPLFCFACGPCAGPAFALTSIWGPLEPLYTNVKRKTGSGDIERNIDSSPNRDLEPASWAQFLLVHQLAWWGYANIRWEWRLASAIPPDVPGATIETTVADMELLALMFGMVPCDGQNILSRSLCGEEIILSRHPILGRLAFYRSGRENIEKTIRAFTPEDASQWLHLCIEAAQIKKSNFAKLEKTYPTIVDEKGLARPTDRVDSIVKLLSRRRTIFDAQLQFSCGDAMWIFSEPCFLRARSGMWEFETAPWDPVTAQVYIGPAGSGVNSCSCVHCCKTWFESQGCSECQWSTLLIELCNNGEIVVGSGEYGPSVTVRVDAQQLCWAGCGTNCTCDSVARAHQSQDLLSLEESIAIVAINNDWLSGVEDFILRQASESLLLDSADDSVDTGVTVVSSVIAYTELLLLDIRRQIGSTNMWNTEVKELMSDFSPIAMG